MKYQPDEQFRKHLNQQGIRGKRFTIDAEKHAEVLEQFRRWHPEDTEEQLHERAAYFLLWKHRKKHNAKWYLKWLAIGAALLLLILAGSSRADAQVDGIKIYNGGVIQKSWFGGIAKIDCSTNTLCTYTNGKLTITTNGNPFFSGGLTSGTLPESNGASSLIDSPLTDNSVRLQAYNQNITNPSDLNTFIARDDFTSNSGTGWGTLNWTANTITAAPTVAAVAPDGTEIGIVSITTTAVATQGGSLSLPSLTSINAIVFDSQFRFKLSSTASISVNVGYATSSATTLNPANSCYMRYDTASADTKYQYVCAGTTADSAITADTNWHTLRIRATASGTVKMSIDGSAESSFGAPPSQAQFPLFLVETQTSATKALSVGAWTFAAYSQARSL